VRNATGESADRVETLRAAQLLLRRPVDDRAREARQSVRSRHDRRCDVDADLLAVSSDQNAARPEAREHTVQELEHPLGPEHRRASVEHQELWVASDDLTLGVPADLAERRVHRIDHAPAGVDHDQSDLCAGEDVIETVLARLGLLAGASLAVQSEVGKEGEREGDCDPDDDGRPVEARRERTTEGAEKRDRLHRRDGTDNEATVVGRDEDHDDH